MGVLLIGAYFYSRPPAALSTASTDASVAQGKKIFNINCIACHGENAVGENKNKPGGGKKLAGGVYAPALNGTGHAWHHPKIYFYNKLKDGASGSESPMPPFGGILSDQEIVSVIHYFQSLWPTEIKIKYAQRAH